MFKNNKWFKDLDLGSLGTVFLQPGVNTKLTDSVSLNGQFYKDILDGSQRARRNSITVGPKDLGLNPTCAA